ncbi:hypothetical protein COO60DRAFT_434870 [Scenedesmus sp. NREL 46B-D3]|nr:hypothetical protein COO60DRAFT_434870 [Scenedesmus sp. NREL 46B-D3]
MVSGWLQMVTLSVVSGIGLCVFVVTNIELLSSGTNAGLWLIELQLPTVWILQDQFCSMYCYIWSYTCSCGPPAGHDGSCDGTADSMSVIAMCTTAATLTIMLLPMLDLSASVSQQSVYVAAAVLSPIGELHMFPK